MFSLEASFPNAFYKGKLKMKKAKKKSTVKKTVKTKSNAKKPKGTEIQTEHFGKLFYANVIEKNIIEKGVALMTAIKGIYGKFIPELAVALNTYIAKFPKVLDDKKSGGLPAMKKYCWKLFNYTTVDNAGFKTKNESFERNVARAIYLALLIHSKKCKFQVNNKNEILAQSNKVYPTLNVQNLKGKKLAPQINKETKKLEVCTIARMEELFREQILGQKTDNKKLNANKGNTKDTKAKTVSFESILKALNSKLVEINVMSATKLADTIKGTKLSYMKSIAQEITLIVAKLKTLETNKDTGKVSSNNALLFEADKAVNQSKVKIFGTAVLELSKQPQVEKSA